MKDSQNKTEFGNKLDLPVQKLGAAVFGKLKILQYMILILSYRCMRA